MLARVSDYPPARTFHDLARSKVKIKQTERGLAGVSRSARKIVYTEHIGAQKGENVAKPRT